MLNMKFHRIYIQVIFICYILKGFDFNHQGGMKNESY